MAPRTTTRNKPRRSSYTPEQRAERARLDAELLDRAAEKLAGDESVIGDWIRDAVTGMSPRILGYSLRNQMLLMDQAADRGIVLRDVDTFRGWKRRGRSVRKGTQGLRIIRPVGITDDDASGNTDDEAPAPAQPAGDGDEKATRPLFRMMVVFDISQTDANPGENGPQACPACAAAAGDPCIPLCICGDCTGEWDDLSTAEDPAALMWNNHYEQIRRAEYAFNWPADAADLNGARVRVDHDARAVHVAMTVTPDDTDALADLGAAVAQILTRTATDRAAAKAERRQLATAPAALTV